MRDRARGPEVVPATLGSVRTSSFCSSGGCVGVIESSQDGFTVVDTKNGSTLRFTRAEWVEFVAGVKNGEFDAH